MTFQRAMIEIICLDLLNLNGGIRHLNVETFVRYGLVYGTFFEIILVLFEI